MRPTDLAATAAKMLLGWGLGLGLCLAAMPAWSAEPEPIDVLFVYPSKDNWGPAPGHLGWGKYQDAFAAEGVKISVETSPSGKLNDEQFLRKFHVVMVFATTVHGGFPLTPALKAYHQSGGGVMWTIDSHIGGAPAWTREVGKHYDAEALYEKLDDPGKVVKVNRFKEQTHYIWTTDVKPHPVTEGVRGLFLGVFCDLHNPGTVPMRYGPSWTVLIRGMDTTRTLRNKLPPGSGWGPPMDYSGKGTYQASPEVVGVREAAGGRAGRMAVIPIAYFHTFSNWGHPLMNDALMLNGAAGKVSDGLRLHVNAFRWLAEPARKAGMGGYQHPPHTPVSRFVDRPLDWSRMQPLAGSNPSSWKGVVGVSTSASDGEGTVAEYAAEARKLGLDFLVFTENLESGFDRAAYDRLEAACRAATTNEFLALPGIKFRDTIGVTYMIHNSDDRVFNERNLTPDRRVKDTIALGHQPAGIYQVGRVARTTVDPWLLVLFYRISPYAYEDGKLVDDGFETYLSLQGRTHMHRPFSMTVVRSPARLRQTVENAPLTVVRASNLADAGRLLREWAYEREFPQYISSGPLIERWTLRNGAGGHPWSTGNRRMRVEFRASSAAGIAAVRIIEAKSGKVWRDFRPGGEKTFEFFVDEEHKDQIYLVPLVKDTGGRFAIGATLYNQPQPAYVWTYRDNHDCTTRGMVWDEHRTNLHMWEPSCGPWAGGRWNKHFLSPSGGAPNPRPIPAFSAWDGGGIHGSHCNVFAGLVTSDGTREPAYRAWRMRAGVTSFDYQVADHHGDVQFLQDQNRRRPDWPSTSFAGHTEPTAPMKYADIVVRQSAVRPRHKSAFSVRINEVRWKFKQNCDVRRLPLVETWRSYDWGNMVVAFKDRKGDFTGVDDRDAQPRLTRQGVMAAGDYIFLGTDLGGAPAVVNIGDTPLEYSYNNYRSEIFISGRKFRAGETLTARFLTLTKPWDGPEGDNNRWLEGFIRDYAAGGGTPAYTCAVEVGRLRDINYAMNLEAEDGGVTFSIGRRVLPHNVLVKVAGISPNAIAGRYDLGHKQILILPVFEEAAFTSVNTIHDENTRLYVGELFHCDNAEVIMSCVQADADRLLLEIHNPTGTPQIANLSAARGFAPLAGLSRRIDLAAHTSVKLELPAASGSLVYSMYKGDFGGPSPLVSTDAHQHDAKAAPPRLEERQSP